MSAALCGNDAVITFADSGIGIPPRDVEKLGRPFEQGGRASGWRSRARWFELHGGTLAIESEIGMGTTVTVTLPTTAAKPGEAEARIIPA